MKPKRKIKTWIESNTMIASLDGRVFVKHVPSSRHVELRIDHLRNENVRESMNSILEQSGIPLYVFKSGYDWYVRNSKSGHVLPFSGSLCIMGY